VYSLTVEVGEGVGEGVGDGVGVGDGDKVGLGVGVGDGVGEDVGATVCVGVGEIEITGEGEGVGTIVTAGVGLEVALTFTPRLHTLLLPFLIQVNSLFFEISTAPTFLHFPPARGVLADTDSIEEIEIRSVNPIARVRRIREV
jgi:hypothetical protein